MEKGLVPGLYHQAAQAYYASQLCSRALIRNYTYNTCMHRTVPPRVRNTVYMTNPGREASVDHTLLHGARTRAKAILSRYEYKTDGRTEKPVPFTCRLFRIVLVTSSSE